MVSYNVVVLNNVVNHHEELRAGYGTPEMIYGIRVHSVPFCAQTSEGSPLVETTGFVSCQRVKQFYYIRSLPAQSLPTDRTRSLI